MRQNELRAEAKEKLLSDEGIKLRKKLCIEFKRFLMGGLDKVNFEW